MNCCCCPLIHLDRDSVQISLYSHILRQALRAAVLPWPSQVRREETDGWHLESFKNWIIRLGDELGYWEIQALDDWVRWLAFVP